MQITTDDLLQAAQIEERGMLDRKDRSSEIWKQVAINEAAMAIVAVNFPDLKNIEFVCPTLKSDSLCSSLSFTASYLIIIYTLAPHQLCKINAINEIFYRPQVYVNINCMFRVCPLRNLHLKFTYLWNF